MHADDARRIEAEHFIPVVKRQPLVLVEGRGARVRDSEGREYLDLMAGLAVCSLGHCHPELVEAIAAQAGRLMQTTNVFYTEPQLELLERLSALSHGALPFSFVVNSGTEAMEGAVKLAHRATGRTKFVSTQLSFHGRTLGALRLIGQPKHREPYAALLPEPFETLTHFNPVYYMIALVRYGFLGYAEANVALSLLFLTLATGLLFANNLRLFAGGYKLRA